MLSTTDLLNLVLLTTAAVGLIWVGYCLTLRAGNFLPNGYRKKDRHTLEGDTLRSQVIEYHNTTIYRAFEFYFKVALAVFAGMAYVVLSRDAQYPVAIGVLLQFGSWLLVGAAALFSTLIAMHQKSKIERWKDRFAWWEPLVWAEFPLIAVMWSVSLATLFLLLPSLLSAIG